MAKTTLEKALTVAKPKKKNISWDLAEYGNLSNLYAKRKDLVRQENELLNRHSQIVREMANLDSSQDIDEEVEAILADKVDISDLSSRIIQQQQELEREKDDLKLKARVIEKAKKKLLLDIDVLEKEAKAEMRKIACVLLNEERERTKKALDLLHASQSKVAEIHRNARFLGLDGRTYFTQDDWKDPMLRVKARKIDDWYQRSEMSSN